MDAGGASMPTGVYFIMVQSVFDAHSKNDSNKVMVMISIGNNTYF